MKTKEILQLNIKSFADMELFVKDEALRRMIVRCAKTGHLGVQQGVGSKPVCSNIVKDVATTFVEQSNDNVLDCNNVHTLSWH